MIEKSQKLKAKQNAKPVGKKPEVQKPQKPQQQQKKNPVKQEKNEKPIKKEPEAPKPAKVEKPIKKVAEAPKPIKKVAETPKPTKEDKTVKQVEKQETATPVEHKAKAVDSCTLFLKSLPADVTEEELKSLSPEIQEVRIKKSKINLNQKTKKPHKQFAFAYIEFKTEQITNKIYKELQHKKIREKELVLDFVGEKSSYVKKEKPQPVKENDLLKLHIGGFDKSATEQDLKKLFKNCTEFAMPTKRDTKLNLGFAFATYASEEEAKKALAATNGKSVNGKNIVVEYSFKRKEPKKKQETAVEKKDKVQEPANKKAKNEKGQEVAKKTRSTSC